MSVRVRFAPSPTGYLHIGGLRTALYNFLFARQNKGTMILRIEDTDQTRISEGAVENLMSTLQWAGIEHDEGPGKGGNFGSYVQSERLEIYQSKIQKLLLDDFAYPCFCTSERLEEMRIFQQKNHKITGYDKKCRNISKEITIERMQQETHVIRMKVPNSGTLDYTDIVRGKIEFDLSLIEDQILLKSDGYPTYHFANVVDDYLMKVTHVIRGEEWISSMPKHLLLYDYFEWEQPNFAHLPLILNKDKSKLSKRQNDVAVEDYIKKGYLQETVINYLALLGWHASGDQEYYSIEELINEFSIERIHKSGAVFDIQKFNWMNSHYIRKKPLSELMTLCKQYLPADWQVDEAILNLVNEKLERLSEIKDELDFLFNYSVDDECVSIINLESSQKVYKQFSLAINEVTTWDVMTFKSIMKSVQTITEVKGKDLWMPIRIAITGKMHGPDLGSIVEILGQKICKDRVQSQYHG